MITVPMMPKSMKRKEIGKSTQAPWDQRTFKAELLHLCEDLKDDFQGLAKRLGISPAKISRWMSEKGGEKDKESVRRQPTEDDALQLGLVEALRHNLNPLRPCQKWLALSGREIDDEELNAKIEDAQSVQKHIDLAYEDLSRLLSRKGLEEDEARVALSAYFAQRECEHRIQKWMVKSEGKGTVLFFWSWAHGKVVERLSEKLLISTKEFFTSFFRPAWSLTAHWPQERRNAPQISLKGFIVGPDKTTARRLKSIATAYSDLSRTNAFHLYVESGKGLAHPADVWILLGGKDNTLGMFASETWQGFEKILNSSDLELAKNPWRWSSQIAPMNPRSIGAFLNERGISVADDRSVSSKEENWNELDLTVKE